MTNYMILVNKHNKIPSDWESNIELVEVTNGLDEKHILEKKTAEAYKKLREDLINDNIFIELDSAYRSVSKQKELFKEFINNYGEDYSKLYVAIPGTSEHHTGLAIDIKLIKDGKVIDDNNDLNKEKEIFSIIHSKLAKYGFILRYPAQKENITGYGAEAWHFRYIDNIEIANEIMNKGITLEEFLNEGDYSEK